MRHLTITLASVALLLLVSPFAFAQVHPSPATDLDDYWADVSKTIAAGDFDGYAATYHPDAVLVNGSQNKSYPISTALAGWKQGFDDTKAGKMTARVEFRFTRTMRDETTAHQTGIFHYSSTPVGGEMSEYFVHFEALLVYRDGWKLMMEYQQHNATPKEWAAAAD